ncbi:MAG: hypothetical protein ACP5IA_04975 [Sediminispirochaetaceae bacterium]
MRKILLFIAGTLLIASCATAPEPEEAPSAEVVKVDLTSYRQNAMDSKAEADKIKAEKGAPEEYAEARTLYEAAEAAESAEDWETAQENYEAADAAFKKAYEVAAENRQKALEALEEANQAISRVEKNAEEALNEAGVEGGAE